MDSRFRLTGIEEIDRELSRLEHKAGKRIARSSLRAGLGEQRKEIRKRAPVGPTKRLKKSIGSRFAKNRKTHIHEGRAGINVGRKKSQEDRFARHGHLVALGTKRRRTKKTGANRGVMPDNRFVSQGVNAALPKMKPKMIQKAKKQMQKELRT